MIDDRHHVSALLDLGSRRIVDSYSVIEIVSLLLFRRERDRGEMSAREVKKGGRAKEKFTFSFERFEFGNPMTARRRSRYISNDPCTM